MKFEITKHNMAGLNSGAGFDWRSGFVALEKLRDLQGEDRIFENGVEKATSLASTRTAKERCGSELTYIAQVFIAQAQSVLSVKRITCEKATPEEIANLIETLDEALEAWRPYINIEETADDE